MKCVCVCIVVVMLDVSFHKNCVEWYITGRMCWIYCDYYIRRQKKPHCSWINNGNVANAQRHIHREMFLAVSLSSSSSSLISLFFTFVFFPNVYCMVAVVGARAHIKINGNRCSSVHEGMVGVCLDLTEENMKIHWQTARHTVKYTYIFQSIYTEPHKTDNELDRARSSKKNAMNA